MAKAKKKNRKFLKVVIAILVISVFGFGAYHLVIFIKNSSFFNVKSIIAQDEEYTILADNIKHVKGKNIFSLELSRLSSALEKSFPTMAQVLLLRQFPDAIVIHCKKRIPVAKLKLEGQFVFIDRDAVILPASDDSLKDELPLIQGIKTSSNNFRIGKSVRERGLIAALSLVEALQQSGVIGEVTLRHIDIIDRNNLSLNIAEHVEVRVGTEEYKEKLRILNILLHQPDIDLDTIKYIDLRFKEPIVGKK
ncbi:cell division protein FtsQ/DivIB [Candidatus Omnitrophota bacterium]